MKLEKKKIWEIIYFRRHEVRINLQELLPIQAEVDSFVIERLGKEVSVDNLILAFQVELFEYFNAIGT